MEEVSFRASAISWGGYYRAIEGRALRPLFLDAVSRFPAPGSAVDLGCGDGTETRALLERGWVVFAVDSSPEAIARVEATVPAGAETRLTTHVAPFHELELPSADLVYAGLSLPFCAPERFAEAWRRATAAIRPGGLFAGHLFGTNDAWADAPDMTFQTREQLDALLEPLDVVQVVEQDGVGPAVSGPKHWHVFHVIARRRS